MNEILKTPKLGDELMALENMHDEMLRQLKKSAALNETIDKYESVWTSATRNSGLPIPCPSCFIKGSVSRLSPLKDESGISSARCSDCKTKYEWRSPE
jgi:hypothetical protein